MVYFVISCGSWAACYSAAEISKTYNISWQECYSRSWTDKSRTDCSSWTSSIMLDQLLMVTFDQLLINSRHFVPKVLYLEPCQTKTLQTEKATKVQFQDYTSFILDYETGQIPLSDTSPLLTLSEAQAHTHTLLCFSYSSNKPIQPRILLTVWHMTWFSCCNSWLYSKHWDTTWATIYTVFSSITLHLMLKQPSVLRNGSKHNMPAG